ncbi:MAG: type 4a pilus biogenesis protein PilO [Betaproteobacteria bacterium]|jgi:type IV pilus assembly protein PilO|nr:type 4a pilus biogenesis protein PilO [Betaproteobacteria bacterium]
MKGIDFQRLQDDFRGLNFNDPGVWPKAPKIAAFALILVAVVASGWFFDWSDQWSELEQKQQEELKLRESWVNKKRQAINLDEYKRQLEEINRQFDSLVRQLPGKAEMESLLSDINQAGVGRGLQFDLFQPAKDDIREFYAAVPVTISVTGSYNDLGEFASDVAKMPRIVTIKNMVLTAAPAHGSNRGREKTTVAYDGRLKLDATAETYRYLDEEELNRQRGDKK